MIRRGTRVQKWDAKPAPRTIATMTISDVMASERTPLFRVAAGGKCKHGHDVNADDCPECTLLRGWAYVNGVGRVEVVADPEATEDDEADEATSFACPKCANDLFKIDARGLRWVECSSCGVDVDLLAALG